MLSQKKAKSKDQNPQRSLTVEEINELKECFSIFEEQDNKGFIFIDKILKALYPPNIKKVDKKPDQEEEQDVVKEILEELNAYKQPVSFEQFVNVISEKLGDTQTEEGIQKLFNFYDKDQKGFIEQKDIQGVAKQLGETMSEADIKEMMNHIHVLNRTENAAQITFEEFFEIVHEGEKPM